MQDAALEPVKLDRKRIAAYRKALREETKIPAREHATLAKMLFHYDIPLEDVANFLDPKEEASLPKPFSLLDMKASVDLVLDSAKKGKKFAVWADYDADGNTSAAILGHVLESIGVKDATLTIPYRKEGFGLNIPGIRKLHEQGVEVLMVADSGTVAHDQIAEARRLGMEVIVLDHHRPREGEELPDALVVNPNRNDDPSKHGALAAASVSYVFARDLAIRMREQGLGKEADAIDFDRLKAISAIGVVADVVGLNDSANRYIVKEGLKELNSRKYPGINVLKDLHGDRLNRGELTAEDIAFTIGPGINAAGRLGDPMVGMRLLMARTEEEAAILAKKIKAANEERKIITEDITKAAEAKAEAFLKANPGAHFIMVEDAEWHAGVIGIVAGRLKEKYHLPAAVGHTYTDEVTGENRTTYSVRSAEGVDFFDHAVEPILASGTDSVLKIGGHAMAAGATIRTADKEKVRQFIDDHLRVPVEQAQANRSIRYLDKLPLSELQSAGFQAAYARMEPFGQHLRRPRYLLEDVQVKSLKRVGNSKEHIQFALGSADPENRADAVHGGVLFRGEGSTLGNILTSPTRRDERMDMVVDPVVKEYNGEKRVSFTVEDIANVKRLGNDISEQELQERSSGLIEKRSKLQAAAQQEMARKPRRIHDLKDETNAGAQKALKALYDSNIAVLDTETTGLDAGADTATKANGLTQVAMITGMQRTNGNYAPREFNQPIIPVSPAYFAWQLAQEEAARKGQPAPEYDRATYEYTITSDALAVTGTQFTRDSITGPITGMRTGGIPQDAKPFYEVAPKIAKLLTEHVPAAYNAPFDMPVLVRHFSDIIDARPGHPEPRLNIPQEAWEKWQETARNPLLKALGLPEYLELEAGETAADLLPATLTNPAEYRCLMHAAMVHKGFGPSQRLQHVAPRDYGVAFLQDDSAHDALADVGPLVFLLADQLEYFERKQPRMAELGGLSKGKTALSDAISMRGLWQHLVEKAVADGRARTNHENGDIILTFPEGTQELKPFFEAFEKVGERNPRAKAYVGIRSMDDTTVHLMGRLKDKPAPKRESTPVKKEYYKQARHVGLIKKTLTYRDLEGLEAIISAEPFDSSSKLDITLTGKADGKPVTLENLPIGSLRPSTAFLKQHPETLEANLRLIQSLGEEERVGRVTLEEDGISLKGHQGHFGEVKFLTPLPVAGQDTEALAESIKTHLNFLMKVGAVPGVHSTTRELNETFGEEPSDDDTPSGKEPVTYVRLGDKYNVLMEVRKDLLETVATQMGIDTLHLPAELPGGGVVHFDTKANSYLIEGTVENFRDINMPLRDASWLLHRLNNLPGTYSQETEISKDKVVLHFHDGVPMETLEILESSHIAFTAEKTAITIPLGTLMNDPFHWSQEIGERKAAVKANYSRVRPAPPPEHLQVLQKALLADTVESAVFGRDGHIWLSDAKHKSLPFDKAEPRIVATSANTVDLDQSTLKTIPEIRKIAHTGLRYQLGKLGGLEHVPAQDVKLRVDRITLVPPAIEPLQDTGYTGELRTLAEHMQSVHISPLLDNLRELRQSDTVKITHHDDQQRYLQQAGELVKWAEQNAELMDKFNGELNGLLDKELEFRFERGVHGIFDDVASLLLMEDTLRHQEGLGKLPVATETAKPLLETVRSFADGLEKLEFKRERVRSGCIDVQKRMLGFSEGQASRAESLAKSVASYYILQISLDPDHAASHENNARRWLEHIYPTAGDLDEKTAAANIRKIDDLIAKGEAPSEYQAFQLATQLSGSLEKLWDDTRELNRSLVFSRELIDGAVKLDDLEKRTAVRDASALIRDTFQSNALTTLKILEDEGGVSDVRLLDNGRITFDGSAMLADPERWSNRLSELNTGSRPRPKSPYVLYDTSTLLTLLFANENVPGHAEVGLLGTVKDLAELHVETPVVTDMVLAEFLFSSAPLTPKDVFRFDAEGRATGIIYEPPTRTGEAYPKAMERLEFLKDLYNTGNVRFMETRTGKEYLDAVRENRDLQRLFSQRAPQAKPLVTMDDNEIKAVLLDHQSEAGIAIGRKTRQLGLRKDSGEVSIADAIATLRKEHGRELPVFVRYEGTDVRGRIIQRLNVPTIRYNAPIDKRFNPHNTRDTDNRHSGQFDRTALAALGEGSFQSTGGMFLSLATLFRHAGGYVHESGEIDANMKNGTLQWQARDETGHYVPQTVQTAYNRLLKHVGQGLGAERRDDSIKDVRFADTGYNIKSENEFAHPENPSLLHRHLQAQPAAVKQELAGRHMERLANQVDALSSHLEEKARNAREQVGHIKASLGLIERLKAQIENPAPATAAEQEEKEPVKPGSFAKRYARRTSDPLDKGSWQEVVGRTTAQLVNTKTRR